MNKLIELCLPQFNETSIILHLHLDAAFVNG